MFCCLLFYYQFFFKNVTTMKSSVFVLVTLLSTLSMFFYQITALYLPQHGLIYCGEFRENLYYYYYCFLYIFILVFWMIFAFFKWILFVWCLFWHRKNVKRMNVIFAVSQPVAWLVVGCDVFRGFLGIPLPAKQVILERL